MPVLNTEFLLKIGKPEGFTVEDFRKEIEAYVSSEKSKNSDENLKTSLINKIVEENPVDIPPKYLRQQVIQFLSEQTDLSNIPPETLEEYVDKFKDSFVPQVAFEFISKVIAEKEALEVEPQDVKNAVFSHYYQMGIDPRTIIDRVTPGTKVYEKFAIQVLEDMTLEKILETCKIEDQAMEEPVDLENSTEIPALDQEQSI